MCAECFLWFLDVYVDKLEGDDVLVPSPELSFLMHEKFPSSFLPGYG